MVTAEDEQDEALVDRLRHEARDPAARFLDLREEAHARVAHRARFGDGRLDVAPGLTAAPESLDPGLQPGVPDRRRPHVDAPAACSEVESGADDFNRPPVLLNPHARKATFGRSMNEGPEPGGGSHIRVLIADDDEAFRASLEQLIERQPELMVVGAAQDGLEAIELADDLDPDAVVIDLHMPLLDGVTAAARLRRDHPNVCLIALTGDEAPELHKAVREAGADEVLLKTELVEGLVERLSAVREKV